MQVSLLPQNLHPSLHQLDLVIRSNLQEEAKEEEEEDEHPLSGSQTETVIMLGECALNRHQSMIRSNPKSRGSIWNNRSRGASSGACFLVIFLSCLSLNFELFVCSSAIPFPPLSSPNNVIKLIIKTYMNEMLDNPAIDQDQLKHKLSSMNEYISTHPALHQRYLWVGSAPPPDYNPDLHEINFDRNTTRYVMKRKRSNGTGPSSEKEQLPSEEICETKQKWEQINDTHDLYDNKAKVIQQDDMKQFVFSYRCAKNKGKCLGISPLFESECTERYGWMYMYYKPENKPPQWGFVNAPHHCACRLKPKFYQPTISSADEAAMRRRK